MKKFLLTLFSLLFVTSFSYAQSSVITKYEGENLKGVVVSGAFDVNIKLGTETKVEVTMLDEVAGKVTYELTDDNYVRLSYGSNTGSVFVSKKKRPRAEIVLNELEYLKLSGDAVLIGSGTFTTDKFVMNVSGSAFASFVLVDCEEFSFTADGANKVEDIKINASVSAAITSAGSSSVDISGSAPKVKAIASATSSMNLLSFDSPEIDAITSGTAVIKANVTGQATIVSSGLSAFRYTGSGKIIGDGAKKL